MGCNKNMYKPIFQKEVTPKPLGFKKFNNKGYISKIIK